jgi:hypothetical protein
MCAGENSQRIGAIRYAKMGAVQWAYRKVSDGQGQEDVWIKKSLAIV